MKIVENIKPTITIQGQKYKEVYLFSINNQIMIAESEAAMIKQFQRLSTRKRLSRFEKNIIKKIYHLDLRRKND